MQLPFRLLQGSYRRNRETHSWWRTLRSHLEVEFKEHVSCSSKPWSKHFAEKSTRTGCSENVDRLEFICSLSRKQVNPPRFAKWPTRSKTLTNVVALIHRSESSGIVTFQIEANKRWDGVHRELQIQTAARISWIRALLLWTVCDQLANHTDRSDICVLWNGNNVISARWDGSDYCSNSPFEVEIMSQWSMGGYL